MDGAQQLTQAAADILGLQDKLLSGGKAFNDPVHGGYLNSECKWSWTHGHLPGPLSFIRFDRSSNENRYFRIAAG